MLTVLTIAIGSNVDLIIAAIALIIILGYLGEAIFRVTRVPEILILMFIGILISYVLPVAYTSTLRDLTPILSGIALIMIMFNSGRVMKFGDGRESGGTGILLALFDVLFSCIAIALVMHYAFGWPLVSGAILGAIIGETSTIIVIPILKRLKSASGLYNSLVMETTFNTVFSILAFYLLIPIIVNGGAGFSAYAYLQYLADYLSIPVFLGMVTGLAWLVVRSTVKGASSYLASLAIALLLYSLVDFLNGSAVVAVLIYAIILGNDVVIGKLIGIKNVVNNKKLKIVERELEFLLRTFFFVLMGMIAILSLDYLLLAIVATVVTMVLRYPSVRIALHKFSTSYQNLAFSLMQKGLGVAVLSSIVFTMPNIPYSEQIFAVSFMVIVISNVIAAPLLRWTTRGMAVSAA